MLEDQLIGRIWADVSDQEKRNIALEGYIGAVLRCPSNDAEKPPIEQWEIYRLYRSDYELYKDVFGVLHDMDVQEKYFLEGGMCFDLGL